MNLRNADSYNIGLDIGTNSVGWAVTDDQGKLLHFKGKPTWGSRLFSDANPASEARANRGQRRRYERRRWRLNLLQGFFEESMSQIDPDFFTRLKYSYLVEDDRAWVHPLFNGDDISEVAYYEQNPTIYHLRKNLMESNKKEDLRLIYLALHNIVKTRGNFLREGEKLSAKDANMGSSVERFADALYEWCLQNGIECDCINCKGEIADLLQDANMTRAEKKEQLAGLFMLGSYSEYAPDYNKKKFSSALAGSLVGYKEDLSQVFLTPIEDSKFSLKDDEKVEAFASNCPDEGLGLFESMLAMYSSYVLMGILKGGNGETISYVKINEYEAYGNDLQMLKGLAKQYVPDKHQYDAFFRGETFAGSSDYDPEKAKGYTKYNIVRKTANQKTSYESLKKDVEAFFKGTSAVDDERYVDMMARFDSETFLRRLKTSDNGCIPYQLHLEEYDAIIENQGRFYPFLIEHKKELESLVTFRIPYYVGPLSRKNQAEDSHGNARFAWSTRKPGMEDAVIKPWNWEEIIDKNQCAEDFIQRMTSDCTYLLGEPVVPKCSLLYEEFCVLNELNGARFSYDGDEWHRFDTADREAIVAELFHKGKVSYKAVRDWMERHGRTAPEVKGGQGENGFESRMGSYIFFCKDVFHVDELSLADYPMMEEIILWSTLFEDRSILREKLNSKYGPTGNGRLNEEQIKAICKKRFTGWGKLSKKLLTGLKAKTDQGERSIMDVLREGNPNGSKPGKTMILMEILHDNELGFQDLISANNAEIVRSGMSIEDLPGSPALRRSLNQARRIVDEVAKIAGKHPANIYIEETRGEDTSKRGRRTTRRQEHLKEALDKFKEQFGSLDPEVQERLKAYKNGTLDERITLYFMQGGKSLYSGNPINFEDLHNTSLYEVDHILPRTYIKDDSFENKALVFRSENQRKTDTLLLNDSIRRKCRDYWKALHDSGLIGDKKYKNLTREEVREGELRSFIARQLVETSQVMKLARQLLSELYPETNVCGIKANISSQIREANGFVKCRDVNDYHHAHDALIAVEVGRFIDIRYQGILDDPIKMSRMLRSAVKEQARENEALDDVKPGRKNYSRTLPGDTSFVARGFCRKGVNKETGELWDAEAELAEIRRSLGFKDCFITRMPEITTDSFWKATIASPNTRGSQDLPLKSDRPSDKYGSYTEIHFAYFFVYEMKNKKGKREYVFSQVPVSVEASGKANGNHTLEEIALRECAVSNGEFVGIIRPVVYKQQLIDVEGERFRITGKKKMIDATQLAFSLEQTLLLKVLFGFGDDEYKPGSVFEKRLLNAMRGDGIVDLSDWPGSSFGTNAIDITPLYSRLFDEMAAKMMAINPRQSELANAIEVLERAKTLDWATKGLVVKRLLALTNGQDDRADLSDAGGKKMTFAPQPSFRKLLNAGSLTFIDQSVTGMFERRRKLEL